MSGKPGVLLVKIRVAGAGPVLEDVAAFHLVRVRDRFPDAPADVSMLALCFADETLMVLDPASDSDEPRAVLLAPHTGPVVVVLDDGEHQWAVGPAPDPSSVSVEEAGIVVDSVEPTVFEPVAFDAPALCMVTDRAGNRFVVLDDFGIVELGRQDDPTEDSQLWMAPFFHADGLHIVPSFFLAGDHQELFQLRYEIGRPVYLADQLTKDSDEAWVDRFETLIEAVPPAPGTPR